MLRRRSSRAELSGLGITAIAGAATLDCRDATAIAVTIETDGCSRINTTVVMVDTPEGIEADNAPVASRAACESPPRIGTLTIVPKGAKDAVVAVKVVTGVDATPDKCLPPEYKGCIVARRAVRFAPHDERELSIFMSLACENRSCDAGSTCRDGVCVPLDQIPPIGNPPPPPSPSDGGDGAPGDGDLDGAPVDAGPRCDPTTCTGGNRACDPEGFCHVDCKGGANVCTGQVCPPNNDCRVTCGKADDCETFECASSGRCKIECKGAQSCEDVKCNAGSCEVSCTGDEACAKLRVDAGSAQITCSDPPAGGGGKSTCDDVACAGGACSLTCTNACGADQGRQSCCAASCSPGPWESTTTCPP
jgi:hypothetical protein